MDDLNRKKLEDFLRANTKRGNWNAVVAKYEEASKVAQKLKLTKQGDTALHLAVIDNKDDIVEQLVKLICRSKKYYKTLLEAQNMMENNALHLAVTQGCVKMCHTIAVAHDELVDMRNANDETPLFLAAMYGHEEVFYCLYYFCRNDPSRITANCRVKKGGDTVVHCALRNEQFDFAFQLLHNIEDAKHWVNEQGLTPLHVLASKSSCFKSGANMWGWQNIIYYWTLVNQLQPQSIETLCQSIETLTKSVSKKKKKETVAKECKKSTSKTASYFPDHYATCIDFFTRLWDGFLKVSTLKRLVGKKKNDEVKNDMVVFEKAVNVGNKASNTSFRENYITSCINFYRIFFWGILNILGFASAEIRKIQEKKEKHTWSVQVMEKLLESAQPDKYGDDGRTPMDSKFQTADTDTHPYDVIGDEVQFSKYLHGTQSDLEEPKHDKTKHIDTEILVAAKNGVIEIVKAIFERFPLAIRDVGKGKKNVVLLAAEHRQPNVYRFLLKKKKDLENQFRAVDDNGNSVLHLAAQAMDRPVWCISGVAFQMQWEVKWYEYVKQSLSSHFIAHYNKQGKDTTTVFHDTHGEMTKESGVWLAKTSKSCSVVGTLIVTVAFTSAASIPGGFDNRDGIPLLEKQQAFLIFAVFSLIALCLSSTSVIMFLSILTYRFDAKDYKSSLPWKLFVGFFSLFFSIISMLISFCAGHYFLIDQRLKKVAVLLYTLIFLPVVLFFLVSKLPLYVDVLMAIFKITPIRSVEDVLSCPPVAQPFQNGKFDVISIPVENLDNFSPSTPLLIFTPTKQGSYPVILFLPGCVQSVYSDFLRRIASHGFVIVAPQFTVMQPTSEMKKTQLPSQLNTWLASNKEMVEKHLSKLPKLKGEETKFFLTLDYGSPSNPFSALIGFDPVPGAEFLIQKSQIETQALQSSNISSPNVESQLLVSKLCGTVKLLVS